MKRLQGFLLGLLAASCVAGTPALAERVMLECKPVVMPEQKPCTLGLYFERGHMPNRCKVS